MDPGAILSRVGKTSLTVTRATGATTANVSGFAVPGGTTTIAVSPCSVQPLKASELAVLEEGWRVRGAVWVITSTQLQTGGDGSSGTAPDQFTWNSSTWQVMQVNPWLENNPGFWKCLAVRVPAA
jgi:hypothetical protein